MTGIDSEPPVRNNWFVGKLLTADDLRLEQDYHIGRRRSHNRCVHCAGVVCGLRVSVEERRARVEPGLALDCRRRGWRIDRWSRRPVARVR